MIADTGKQQNQQQTMPTVATPLKKEKLELDEEIVGENSEQKAVRTQQQQQQQLLQEWPTKCVAFVTKIEASFF
jgi:hypothetical protein